MDLKNELAKLGIALRYLGYEPTNYNATEWNFEKKNCPLKVKIIKTDDKKNFHPLNSREAEEIKNVA